MKKITDAKLFISSIEKKIIEKDRTKSRPIYVRWTLNPSHEVRLAIDDWVVLNGYSCEMRPCRRGFYDLTIEWRRK